MAGRPDPRAAGAAVQLAFRADPVEVGRLARCGARALEELRA